MSIVNSTHLITKYGKFKVCYHQFEKDFCISVLMGNISRADCIVRLHSSCLFSESFNSIDCDCDLQLTNAMKLIGKEKRGVIIYLYQEGRGHGLVNKIKAMETERIHGIDTVEAFTQLHFDLDPRNYTIAISALKELKVNKNVRLISNNPLKIKQLEKGGFKVTDRVSLIYPTNRRVKKYLKIKKNKLDHEIEDKLIRD